MSTPEVLLVVRLEPTRSEPGVATTFDSFMLILSFNKYLIKRFTIETYRPNIITNFSLPIIIIWIYTLN